MASSVISSLEIRRTLGSSLAAGQQVFIDPAGGHPSDLPGAGTYAPELQRQIVEGRAAVASVRFDDKARSILNLPGMTVGAGAGTLVGAAIGILLEQVRAVHPASAVAFDAACAAIGCGLGGAVGSGLFTLEGTMEHGKFGLKIAPVIPK